VLGARHFCALSFASECLLSVPCAEHFVGLLRMLKQHPIHDTQQCKTSMTLSDYKGKQIVRDTIQKCLLQDFLPCLGVVRVTSLLTLVLKFTQLHFLAFPMFILLPASFPYISNVYSLASFIS
jgi:hypothetical protein